jgi:hypothetical protein
MIVSVTRGEIAEYSLPSAHLDFSLMERTNVPSYVCFRDMRVGMRAGFYVSCMECTCDVLMSEIVQPSRDIALRLRRAYG